jgi:hypothetical protein
MLNWALLKNPLNWLIVVMMIVIVGFAADIILQHYHTKGAK